MSFSELSDARDDVPLRNEPSCFAAKLFEGIRFNEDETPVVQIDSIHRR